MNKKSHGGNWTIYVWIVFNWKQTSSWWKIIYLPRQTRKIRLLPLSSPREILDIKHFSKRKMLLRHFRLKKCVLLISNILPSSGLRRTGLQLAAMLPEEKDSRDKEILQCVSPTQTPYHKTLSEKFQQVPAFQWSGFQNLLSPWPAMQWGLRIHTKHRNICHTKIKAKRSHKRSKKG